MIVASIYDFFLLQKENCILYIGIICSTLSLKKKKKNKKLFINKKILRFNFIKLSHTKKYSILALTFFFN